MKRPWLQQTDPVEGGSRETDPTRDGSRANSAKGACPVLRRYLQEMGVTPLLEPQRELQLARQLTCARLAIAKLAQALPESCRELVLAGDASGPQLGADWPLSDVESFLGRLARHSADCPDTAVASVLREIRAHKSSLDDARDALILANLRLVVHIAKKYAKSGLPIMDLIQDGNLGLLRAVEKFEHERGHKFSTYAFWWIKQSVERGIAEKSRTIRIPVHVNEAIRRVGVASRDLRQSLGRQATPREIATQLRVPIDTVDQALSVVREPMPLENNNGERGGYDLATSVPDVASPSPLHAVSQREIEKRVDSALKELNPREETIVRMRFGIGREVATTLEQIGGRLSLSRERVRQIEGLALAKIKASPLCRELAELFGVGATRGLTGSATSRFAR
jgi:RNA polymerase sigma factor (sigma-70 family)